MDGGWNLKVGALVAVIAGIVGLLGSILGLYVQAANIIGPIVEKQIKVDFAPVGTVVASLLPPVEFAKATGETEGDEYLKRTWIFADGQKVPGTAFAKLTGDKPVPELRGMFLRGIDVTDSRQPGDRQPYATALPVSKRFTGMTDKAGAHWHAGGMQLSKVGDKYNVGGSNYLAAGTANTEIAGEHTHTLEITDGGDVETRPVNVAVFYYIKIN